ncbi:class F sortase [Dictyobacter arantiisoli]|uniref:Class F sortase n=1 Tax=Dictyobacter arantiisoli TaxID=2014874 RepID=A0A5A5TIW4_9CHLR|nr:class F sortase [Dictyobacter arantiisoli]GCF11158.1 class F sortase [Dictyobacter arantiisoli]
MRSSARHFSPGLLAISLLVFLSGCGSATQAVESHPAIPMHLSAPTVSTSLILTSTPTPREALPVHIRIPAIGVDADIEQVSILSTGNLDTPQINPWDETGWYKDGARPGEQGSAVIDGHVDRPGGGPAVFWNLRDMKPGDEVIITTQSGAQLHFSTTRRIAYPPSQAPLQGIFGDNSGKYLNLITCAGDWVPSQHQTTLRMVVFTRLQS